MRNNFEVGLVVAGVLSAVILLVKGTSVLIAISVMLGIVIFGLSLEDEMKTGEDDECIEKHNKSLDENAKLFEKAIKKGKSLGEPIYNELFFCDEYGNPMPKRKVNKL